MKHKSLLVLFLVLVMLASGCSRQVDDNISDVASSDASETVDSSEVFSDRDFEVGYDESSSTVIQLNGDTAACDSNAVQISGGTVTIIEEGTYILSGTLDDGMIIVNSGKDEKIQLVLDGVTIHSETSAAIYILQSDKVFITMTEGSVNTLSNGGTFTAIDENNIDAVIFSKEDVTLNGSGTLIVTSPAGHGIVSKDSLTITSGSYDINCASHALAGKDDVCIANAEFTIVSGKDGIHAENDDDADLGFVYIRSGTFDITAEGDGISASAFLQIEDGSFNIISGGGSVNAAAKTSDSWGSFMGGGRHQGGKKEGIRGEMPDDITGEMPDEMPEGMSGEMPDEMPGDITGEMPDEMPGDITGEMPDEMPEGMSGEMPDEMSEGIPGEMSEGIPGEMPGGMPGEMSEEIPDGMPDGMPDDITGEMPGEMFSDITAGTTEASTDSTSIKGIKAAGNLIINGGTFFIDSADDSVHSNQSITINGGTFEIASGDDAFHADDTLTITAGTINITESYEGLEGLHVIVSGGEITLVASDDGLNAAGGTDSSGTTGGRDGMFGGGMSSSSGGSILISGGTIHVTASGDGIDANGTLEITGGYITVCGPTQGDTSTLDYDISATISGGTFIGTGAAGMAQTFSDSEQGVISVSVGSQSAGTEIQLTDSDGNTVITYTPDLSFAVVILSSPDIIKGETYTVTVGSSSGTVTAD